MYPYLFFKCLDGPRVIVALVVGVCLSRKASADVEVEWKVDAGACTTARETLKRLSQEASAAQVQAQIRFKPPAAGVFTAVVKLQYAGEIDHRQLTNGNCAALAQAVAQG